MSQKLIIIITLTIVIGFFLVVGAIVGVYKYKPQWLGLPPRPEDTVKVHVDTTPKKPEVKPFVEPKVEMTKWDYDSLQVEMVKRAISNYQNLNLMHYARTLQDSINKLNQSVWAYKDAGKRLADTVRFTKYNYQKFNDSLAKLYTEISRLKAENENTKKMTGEQKKVNDKRTDSLNSKQIEAYSKIYNDIDPVKVAKILEQLDERDASRILKLMNKKKAGKVIESMLPENAAAILMLGGGK